MRLAILILSIIVGLTGLYFGMSKSALRPEAGAAGTRTYAITLKNLELVGRYEVMPVNEGDTVTLKVSSDKATVLVVHDYEKQVNVEAGIDAQLTFVAERSGRFFIHLHTPDGQHIEVGELEIAPR